MTTMSQAMQSFIDRDILSCVSYCLIDDGEVVASDFLGFQSKENEIPLREDSIYRIYSNTKIVTSVALMKLFERGAFALDDRLAEYLPAFANMNVLRPDASGPQDVHPAKNPILMRHVLSHSAGFSYGFIEPESVIDQAYVAAGINPGPTNQSDLAAFCDTVAALPLAYEPGTFWRYSVATDVCARLVEVLSGQSFGEFLKREIFEPLAMHDTGFFVPASEQHRLISMYAPKNPLDPMASGMTLAEAPESSVYLAPPRFESGGGGLVSTLQDYVSFVQMITHEGSWRGATILKPETLALMRTNQLPEGVGVNFPFWAMPGTVFGLGFALRSALFEGESSLMLGEYHWGGMAGTHSFMSPEGRFAGLCFTQRMPGFWHPFSHVFKKMAYEWAEARL
ncbi:MAG: serine hydrolase domain-containing protein [Pseudomonadales bacterium]